MALGSRSYQRLQQPRVSVLPIMVVVMLWLAVAGFPPTTGWLAMTHGPTHGSALPCLAPLRHHLQSAAADCKGRIHVWQASIVLLTVWLVQLRSSRCQAALLSRGAIKQRCVLAVAEALTGSSSQAATP